MNQINGRKLGFALGGFLGFVHLVWSVLVLLGWAGPLQAFIYKLHFMSGMAITLDAFNVINALGLVIVTFAVGFIFGNVFAYFYNRAFRG